jgi:diguanylate cyclase (GGDEF)-like protein
MSRDMSTTAFLHKIHIFADLTEAELSSLAAYMHPLKVKKNAVLCKEGDPGDRLFIIKKGTIASTINLPDGKQQKIAQFSGGDFFGEMAIFENAPRSATCFAEEAGEVFIMHKDDFYKAMESDPQTAIAIMYKMLSIITQRLRNTGRFLSDMVRWGNEASKRAITDELTGVYNRRYLDSSLQDMFRSALSLRQPLSLMMIDLDFFREINEQYSPQTGNRALCEVAGVFKQVLKTPSVIARYGGDEFTIILPDTNTDQAMGLAEIIRQKVADLEIFEKPKAALNRITLSIGIAAFPENGKELAHIKDLADKALYSAKEHGRNRVECAAP